MITLKQLAVLFIRDFNGGAVPSKDNQLDPRDVILKARHYLGSTLKPILWEKKADGDNSAVSQAIYTYDNLSLETESGTNQKYITIPDSYMAWIHNKGIHRIFAKGNPYSDFVLQHTPGISSNLPHMKLQNIQYCYVEGRKIKFGKGCTAKRADRIVLQIINIAPDALGEDDPLPIAPEQLAEVNRLLKMDFAPFSQITDDKLNNNNAAIK